MQALLQLTVANIRSFTRDRAALFWTIAFPLIFVLLFGLIFQSGPAKTNLAWVDEDGTPAANALREGFASIPNVSLTDAAPDDAIDQMKVGKVDAIVVVPQGYAKGVAAGTTGGGAPAAIEVYTDPSQQVVVGRVQSVVGYVLGIVNLGGRPPIVVPQPKTVQTQNLNMISYLVPSILGMALMQLGVFAAIPLVADREKLILKRLNATPLRRWQLVASNLVMRLLIGIAQTLIIIGVGAAIFGVTVSGNLVLVALLVLLGTLTFVSLGYVIASFAPTEDAANGMTSVVQFPLMFLSGTFFPIDVMPDFLKTVARAMPLTYLSDALRQVMVGGAAFSPLWVCFAVLAGWLVACFAISARYFRWQ